MLSRLTTNLVIRCKLNIKEVKLESTTGDTWDNNRLINKILLDIPGGTPLDKLYRYVRCQRIWFSKLFWSENGDSSASYQTSLLLYKLACKGPWCLAFRAHSKANALWRRQGIAF